MIHQPEYVKVLLRKYIEGTASPQEVARLMAAWDIYDDEELSEMIAEVTGDYKNIETEEWRWEAPVEESLKYRKGTSRSVRRLLIGSYGYGRIILLTSAIVGVCFLIWVFNKPKLLQRSCNGVPGNTELPTGRYTCRLLLADNCSILIDSNYKGLITQQGGVEITQPEPGLLIYKLIGMTNKEKAEIMYNTVETSPGQQYQVILPDGSKVRLNAASSIRFPVKFSNNKRIVNVTGEAFFDVAHDRIAPFYVYTSNSEIKVLGTTFNVNAYSKRTVTTLLTGSLEIKSGSQTARLTSGEKATALVSPQVIKDTIILTKEDTLHAVSWKNVNRIYSNISMRDFVSDMGRWYNLEFINLSCVPATASITVSMCYDIPLDEVLNIFRETGLKFYKDGNRITFCDQELKPRSTKPIPFR